MVHISSLPDLCLLLVFKKLDLSNLYRTTQVCRQWRSLRSHARKQRRSLGIWISLEIGLKKKVTFRFNKLIIDGFNDENIKKIIAKFPNVRVLRITDMIHEESSIFGVALFLSNPKWKSQLIYLKLDGFWQYEDAFQSERPYDPMVQSINSLSSLKHLVLKDAICPSFLSDITIFPRLKDLTIIVQGHSISELVDFMVTLQNPDQLIGLKEIKLIIFSYLDDLDYLHGFSNYFDKLLKMHPDIARKIISLNFLSHLGSQSLFRRYCAHFPCIREAHFNADYESSWFPNQFTHLAKLTELRQLTITLHDEDFPEDSGDLQLKPMLSLERLTICYADFSCPSSLNVSRLYVSRTFPNISELCIKYNQIYCNVCGVRLDKASQAKFRKCINHLIKPFKRCQRLEKIAISFENLKIPVQKSKAKKHPINSKIAKNACVILAPFEKIQTAFW